MSRKMKDSGIEWIGEIPEDWNVTKLNNLIVRISTGLNPRDNFLLGEGSNYYVTIKNFKCGKLFLDKNCDRVNDEAIGMINKRSDLNEGDILFASISKEANIFLIPEKPINWNINESIFTIRTNNSIFNNYFASYVFVSSYFYNNLLIDATGSTFLSIKQNALKANPVVVPTSDEQIEIANYLDSRCTLIDQTIEKQKQVIEKLKEYKQSVITEAVTKGLNPNVPMKDSGIEWIGEIPEHWDVIKIKNLFSYIDCRNTQDENAILLSLFTAIGVKPRSEMEDKGNKAATVIGYKYVEKDDLIVNKLLAWMGAVAFSDYEGVTSPDYDVYRIKENANAVKDYYNCYFRFTKFKDDCFKYGHGIMMMRWRTYPSEFLNIFVVNPPKEEQEIISQYVVKRNIEIDNAIETKEKVIEKLESYKKSLIFECVTGKREVK